MKSGIIIAIIGILFFPFTVVKAQVGIGTSAPEAYFEVKMPTDGNVFQVGTLLDNSRIWIDMGDNWPKLSGYSANGSSSWTIGSTDVMGVPEGFSIISNYGNGPILFGVNANTEVMRITTEGTVAIGTTKHDPTAILDLSSGEKGFLIPRMQQSKRNLILNPATGLLIYQTDLNPGFYYYNGSAWTQIGAGSVSSVTAQAPLTGGTITSSGSIGIDQATALSDGYLSSSDWATFNGKENPLTFSTPYLSRSGNTVSVNVGTTSTTVAQGNHSHSQLHNQSHAMTSATDHTATAWRMFYSNASGAVTELGLGSSGQVLKSSGSAAAPSWQPDNSNSGTVTSINGSAGITSSPNPITTTGTFSLTGQALAFHNLANNGLVARTASGTITARSIATSGNAISISNGDGVSGNPTLSLSIGAGSTQVAAGDHSHTGLLSGGVDGRIAYWTGANSIAPSSLLYYTGNGLGINSPTVDSRIRILGNVPTTLPYAFLGSTTLLTSIFVDNYTGSLTPQTGYFSAGETSCKWNTAITASTHIGGWHSSILDNSGNMHAAASLALVLSSGAGSGFLAGVGGSIMNTTLPSTLQYTAGIHAANARTGTNDYGIYSSALYNMFTGQITAGGAMNTSSTITAAGQVTGSTFVSSSYSGGGLTTANIDNTGKLVRGPSDERLKTNIVEYTRGLETLMQFRPVKYNYKDQTRFGSGDYIGFIAQEVETVVPEAVKTANDEMHSKSFSSADLVPVLVNAIKEQQQQIEALQRELSAMKNR